LTVVIAAIASHAASAPRWSRITISVAVSLLATIMVLTLLRFDRVIDLELCPPFAKAIEFLAGLFAQQ
jgi:hypothetical protein